MKLLRRGVLLLSGLLLLFRTNLQAQDGQTGQGKLPMQYEELTAPEFVNAVAESRGVCVIPIGILEKHGPELPLGTDLLDARETVLRAARKEYCVVFPQYYFGQIFEAKHQPGAVAYSPELVWKLLQETCDELARNGFTRIILANGHGGNNYFLPYFCQAQLASRKNYTVVLFRPADDPEVTKQVSALRKTRPGGGHADEIEASMIMAHRPDLVHVERGKDQSGEDLQRLASLPYAFTGIWWYARFPNHYAGDGSAASKQIGDLIINSESDQLVKLVKAMKQDTVTRTLQQQFFDSAEHPLQTKQ